MYKDNPEVKQYVISALISKNISYTEFQLHKALELLPKADLPLDILVELAVTAISDVTPDYPGIAAYMQGNTIKLYHGNKDRSMCPKYGIGSSNNDYGRGFYTTPIEELGKEWAWSVYTTGEAGYLHEYLLDLTDMRILDFTCLDSLHWIAELLFNRSINFRGREALQDTRDTFVSKYKLDTEAYDIIVGYRADDSYFAYTVDFLSSAIYRGTIDSALKYGDLGVQVFIKSPKAFDALNLVQITEVDKSYQQKYKDRDSSARMKYKQAKSDLSKHEKITIHDLL